MANVPAGPATSVRADPEAANESRVGNESHFNGLYQTKQNLRIEGVAEGEIECDGTVTVVEGARVKAKVTASTVTIAGELEGEVMCRGTFQILPSGQVQATVMARRLVVHEGGFYNGEFHMINEQSSIPARGAKELGRPSMAEKSREMPREPESKDEWWAKMGTGLPSAEEPDKQTG